MKVEGQNHIENYVRDIIKYYMQTNLKVSAHGDENDAFEESEHEYLTHKFDTFARTCNFYLSYSYEQLSQYLSYFMAEYEKAIAARHSPE